MSRNTYSVLLPILILVASGNCSAPAGVPPDRDGIETNPFLFRVTREQLSEGPIELPQNYNEEHYRQLVMAVNFQKVSYKAGEISPEVGQTVSARLQTEIVKLKRFTIFSLHLRGGVRVLQNLSAVGEANIEVPEGNALPNIDLVLTGALTLSRERQERYNVDELIYEVECDFNCEDVATRTSKFAQNSKGRAKRTVSTSLTGKRLGGFDINDEEQAIHEAAMKALAGLANKLGHEFPVGGEVTGILGDRMQMNRGVEHGIAKRMQMILYTRVSGVDLPIGIAEAQPGPETAALVVWRWNTEDPYAREVIDEIKSNREWLKDNKLLACSAGTPLPPEWEQLYED
ncbi:MAG: hypothetical protein O6952_03735 [Planctomycetota bacterium]|nr:hypothetical protein [Planctomycetota bacterium]